MERILKIYNFYKIKQLHSKIKFRVVFWREKYHNSEKICKIKKVQKLFQNAYHENPDKSNQEIIDEIVMEIEEQVPSRDHNIE